MYNPFLPFLSGTLPARPFSSPPPAPPTPEAPSRGAPDNLEQLRREVDALKRRLRKTRKPR